MTTSGKIAINGSELFYERLGSGKHAVLLLNGALGFTKIQFGPVMQKLNNEEFSIVGFDTRGYGESRPPDKEITVDFLRQDADDGAALMQTLGFTSYSLLGWSDGANVGMIMAAKYPDQVRKLVIWGGNSYNTPEDMVMLAALRDNPAILSEKDKKVLGVDIYGEETFSKLLHDWLENFFRMPKCEDGTVDLFRKDLEKINCATLIIHGLKDELVPKHHADFIHEKIKGSKIVFWEDAPHELHLEHTDRLVKVTNEFLLD